MDDKKMIGIEPEIVGEILKYLASKPIGEIGHLINLKDNGITIKGSMNIAVPNKNEVLPFSAPGKIKKKNKKSK